VRIETERLDLLPLEIDVLRDIVARRLEAIAAALGAEVPPSFPDGVPAELRIAQLERDPAEQPWLVRAIVLREERRVVGAAGFHSPPDAGGRAELGYEIVADERRRGFAREAVAGLMAWAASTGSVQAFRASIAPENTASQALVASLGFERVGEQIDPEDGLEWVFERSP
jgi:RimJ/RimL family protein N-acetyltransferase